MREELKHPDSKRYIYTIRDANGCVRYVGVTWNIEQRIGGHLFGRTPISKYIAACRAKGKRLKLQIECETTYDQASQVERQYIEKYAKTCGRKLLNQQGNAKRRDTLRWQAFLASKKAAKALA